MLNRFTIAFASALLAMSAAQAIELKLLSPATYSPASGFAPGAEIHQALYDEFEAQNPDITIVHELLADGPDGLQRLLAAASTNNLGDVAVIDGQFLARLHAANVLVSLEDRWSEDDRADFHPDVLNAVMFDGEAHAIMFQTGMRGMIYRPSALQAAGLDAFPSTWEELLEATPAISAAGMTPVLLPAKAADEPSMMHLLAVFWGLGGDLVDAEGAPVFFDETNGPILEQAIARYVEMVDTGMTISDIAVMDEAALRPYLYTGEALSIGGSSSNVRQIWSDLPDTANDLAVAPYPMPAGQQAVTILGGNTYAITTTDPERQDAAWRFVEFMTSAETMSRLNEAMGHLPVRASIWSSNNFYAETPIMVAFKQLYDGQLRTRPPVALYNTISTSISTQLSSVVSGAITPDQAVASARDLVLEEVERQSTR